MRARVLTIFLALLVPLAALLVITAIPFAVIEWFFGGPYACLTQVHRRISDISGLTFEIRETDCDRIAKEGWISIYASRPGQSDNGLVFQYDEGGAGPLPRITAVDPRTVRISIPAISEIHLRRHTWDGVTIEYDIGHIEYPHPERDK